jgi:hypothetical protein
MQTRKIPGVRSYRAAPDGVREMLLSADVSKAAQEVAAQIAAVANDAGDATYSSGPADVRGGWDNERRAGASVYVVEPHWRDSRDEVLKRVGDAMTRRSRE